jgi:hypothetical protein
MANRILPLFLLLIFIPNGYGFFSGGNGDHVGNGGGLAEIYLMKTYEDFLQLEKVCLRAEDPCNLKDFEAAVLKENTLLPQLVIQFEKNPMPEYFELKGEKLIFHSPSFYSSGEIPLSQQEIIDLSLPAILSRSKLDLESKNSLIEKLKNLILEQSQKQFVFGSFKFIYSSRKNLSDLLLFEDPKETKDILLPFFQFKKDTIIQRVNLSRFTIREKSSNSFQIQGTAILQGIRENYKANFVLDLSINEEGKKSVKLNFSNSSRL